VRRCCRLQHEDGRRVGTPGARGRRGWYLINGEACKRPNTCRQQILPRQGMVRSPNQSPTTKTTPRLHVTSMCHGILSIAPRGVFHSMTRLRISYPKTRKKSVANSTTFFGLRIGMRSHTDARVARYRNSLGIYRNGTRGRQAWLGCWSTA
jgi:hypothetical protein